MQAVAWTDERMDDLVGRMNDDLARLGGEIRGARDEFEREISRKGRELEREISHQGAELRRDTREQGAELERDIWKQRADVRTEIKQEVKFALWCGLLVVLMVQGVVVSIVLSAVVD